MDPDKGFVLRTDASDYAVGAVLEQIRDNRSHVPVAFWSRILAEGQRQTWTAREKETYAIVCALRKWSGHIGLQPVVVCTDHQSLQSWHKEHVDTPSGPAARRARWLETFAKFDLSVLYLPGKDNTVADCLSRWAYPAGKAWMDISSHGDAEETEEAKRIIEMEKAMEQEGVKCFVVMANCTDLAKFWGARVQAIRDETLEQWMVAPVELVRSVLTEDWSDDYAASDHWSKYWNALSAPSDDEWPKGLTEDGDKLFPKDKLLVPENPYEPCPSTPRVRIVDSVETTPEIGAKEEPRRSGAGRTPEVEARREVGRSRRGGLDMEDLVSTCERRCRKACNLRSAAEDSEETCHSSSSGGRARRYWKRGSPKPVAGDAGAMDTDPSPVRLWDSEGHSEGYRTAYEQPLESEETARPPTRANTAPEPSLEHDAEALERPARARTAPVARHTEPTRDCMGDTPMAGESEALGSAGCAGSG